MSQNIDELSAAVVTQLNAHTFSPTFVAVFDDKPQHDIKELGTLRVDVMPQEAVRKPVTRGHDSVDYTIDVGIQQKAEPREHVGVDSVIALSASLRGLAQSVCQWLSIRANRIPSGYLTAKLIEANPVPLYDADLLREERRFIGVVRLKYREIVRPA